MAGPELAQVEGGVACRDTQLDEVDEEFYEDKDNLFERVVDYAVAKNLIPPIEH